MPGIPATWCPSLIGRTDGAVLGIGSMLRLAHVTETNLTDVAASTLAHRLVSHLLQRYAGLRPPKGSAGRLRASAVDRVTALVETRMADVLTLDELAAEARLSVYHFSRAFRATTGIPQYAFVSARRMDRARLLLRTTNRPVEEIAAAVGYTNLSHFRRVFRRMNGALPSALRD